jgi:hypothetical protein
MLRQLKQIREEHFQLRDEVQGLARKAGALRAEEVRWILRMGSCSDRLGEIVFREGTSLAFLRFLGQEKAGYVLRQAVEAAVERVRPAGEALSLDELRDRPIKRKRKTRLPVLWADYYTARLFLAGHTVESIAERLELSPRQVYHYLDRLAVRLVPFLETEIQEIALQLQSNFRQRSLTTPS